MDTYTVFAYIVPDGGHHVEAIDATSGTQTAVRVRDKLGFSLDEFEVIAIAHGRIPFERVDARQIALAPYSAMPP